MSREDDFPTFYVFSPPAGDPHGWALELDAFMTALREGFPTAYDTPKPRGNVGESVFYVAETDDGITFEGTAGVTTKDRVGVWDVTAAEAARFVVWLRAAVVPDSAEIWFTSEAAIEEGLDEREWQIPVGADRGGVEAALRGHLADVFDAEIGHAHDDALAEDARRRP